MTVILKSELEGETGMNLFLNPGRESVKGSDPFNTPGTYPYTRYVKFVRHIPATHLTGVLTSSFDYGHSRFPP